MWVGRGSGGGVVPCAPTVHPIKNESMIDYIAGEIAELTPATCVIDCSGVGYEIGITLVDYPQLQKIDRAKLYVHESIRDDAHVLFGFLTKESRALFRLLVSVSGVGPGTARLILSSLTADQLSGAIASGNSDVLKAVKGIGGKTAQRIIVDLKDKINNGADALSLSAAAPSGTYADALAALVTLGYNKPLADKTLRKAFADNPALTTEQAIRVCLAML